MADLELAAAPSKPIANIVQSPGVTPTPLPPRRVKMKSPQCWNSTNRSHRHLGTQIYVTTYNDRSPTLTTDHENALTNTYKPQNTQQTSRSMAYTSKDDVAINVISCIHTEDSFDATTPWHEHESGDDAHKQPHEDQSNLTIPPEQTKHNPPCHPLLPSLHEHSQKLSKIDNKFLVMMDQLRQIEAFFRALQPTCHQTPPAATPINNPNSHDALIPTAQAENTDHIPYETSTKHITCDDPLFHLCSISIPNHA